MCLGMRIIGLALFLPRGVAEFSGWGRKGLFGGKGG